MTKERIYVQERHKQRLRPLIEVGELSQEVARALVASRVLVEVELVVCLSVPPLAGRQDLSNDLALLPPLLLNLLCYLTRCLLLLLVVCKDAATVLAASVRPLAVLGSRVVHAVEEFEEAAV